MDLFTLPIDRVCNLLWTLAMSTAKDDAARMQLQAQLEMPLASEVAEARDDFWAGAEDDAAAFLAARRAGLPRG